MRVGKQQKADIETLLKRLCKISKVSHVVNQVRLTRSQISMLIIYVELLNIQNVNLKRAINGRNKII